MVLDQAGWYTSGEVAVPEEIHLEFERSPLLTVDYETFELGDVTLREGATLREAKLAYKTFGELNDDKSNAIVYPTWYSGQHPDNEWLIGPGMALDPERYFIIIPNMLGNGLSSSPSNTPQPYDKARFPYVTIYDNVSVQHRLVTEAFGIEKIALVTGWSMGAQQTFQWGVSYPEMVERILPFCGSAKTSRHNFVFLEGVKAALTADAAFKHGWYEEPPTTGLRAMARVYAGWGFSQAFYRERLYEGDGYSSLEDFLVAFWEGFFLPKDANNLLAMLWTWQSGDVGMTPGFDGDLDEAMKEAVRETISFLSQTRNLTAEDAYSLASIGIDFQVSQVVDINKGVHANIYKHLFPDGRC